MKKIHIQAQISIVEVAEVAKAMTKKGLLLIRPPDVIRFCFQAAHSILETEPMTEAEAMEFLQKAGYIHQSRLSQSFISALTKKKIATDELEDLIEQVRRGPTTTDEIKEMFKMSMKGVNEGDTHLSKVQEVDSEEVSGNSQKGVQGGKS